jgi:hypothetical protein
MAGQRLNLSNQAMSNRMTNSFRRFGRFGPVYQIMGVSRSTQEGEIMMKIHVLETKEELEYPFSRILEDPQENN